MKKLPRVATAEPVIHGVLKLIFLDGYEGVIDLRPLIARGKVFTWLQDPENFSGVRVDEYGHSISWTDESGYTLDFGADSLRRDCERQAEIHKLMVG
ncbi:hypothetical protein ASG40_03950 [Methylobacterium sp. Leaf399]|uniref:DUF2442 domain-containing protein n=1 Tax=unclassified Methylobacterium TaxID=2615210 RepID=UPI0006FCFDAE|nr:MULTISPECIES: DUF2442 domain-containing protein [unclassified Methylobacterium]KQP61717.1 hypothetical protein ASF39_03360 [Methylobacterium sp. Leaf108]KQT19961.1 hypothetical protein ASG40_03950 [Methylobacterium sp. Leaf399]